MSNRLALVGALTATMAVASPSVTAAQNPWRADPQASGQYMPKATQQSLEVSNPPAAAKPAPKYAPLDGKIDDATVGYPGFVGGANNLMGLGYGAPGYAPGYAIAPQQGAGAYRGLGYPSLGYSGLGYPGGGYPGVGYPGVGYSGLGYPGYGTPGLGWGGLPYNGGGNGFGSPLSWMPFW